jgi:ABC-type phosphate transport system substrate-binding protein
MKSFYVAFLFVSFCASVLNGQLRVGGSDLLAPHLQKALNDYTEARGLEAEVDFAGSYGAFERLRNGELDLAIVAVPDGGRLPEDEFRVVHFASLVVTLAVPAGNPLNQVTMSQLTSLYGEADAAAITRWGQFGLRGEWAARSISLGAVSPVKHGLALDLFRHTVLQARGLRRTLAYYENVEAVRRRFAQDSAGIAILNRIPAQQEGMKVLAVARTDDGLAHPPTLETVAAGEYPLRLPLYLVFAPDRGAEVRDIARFLVGDEASEAVEASGLAPLPEPRRQRLFFEFERL